MNTIDNIGDDKSKRINAAVYVDYENVLKRLKQYNVHPVNDLDLFRHIGKILKSKGINILSYTAYANFDDPCFNKKDQTQVQSYGVIAKHTCNDGKTCSDLDLAVDAVVNLYKNQNIDLFVIISSDRDFISLIKAIKCENKDVYTISTKNGFNEVVLIYTDYHDYIENLFEFAQNNIKLIEENQNTVDEQSPIGYKGDITPSLIVEAKEVSKFLYESPLWKKYLSNENEKVAVIGYSDIICKNIKKSSIRKDILESFNVAHTLGYVHIYEVGGILYFKEGNNKSEVIPKENAS